MFGLPLFWVERQKLALWSSYQRSDMVSFCWQKRPIVRYSQRLLWLESMLKLDNSDKFCHNSRITHQAILIVSL